MVIGQHGGGVGRVGQQPAVGRGVRLGQHEALGQREQYRAQQEAGQPLAQGLRGVGREARQDVEQLHPGRCTGDPRPRGARVGDREPDDQHAQDGGPGLYGEQRAQRDECEPRGKCGECGRRALPPGAGDAGKYTERYDGEGGVHGHDGTVEAVAAEVEGDAGGGRHADRGADDRALPEQALPAVLQHVAQPALCRPHRPAGRMPRPGARGLSLLRAHLSTIGQVLGVRTASSSAAACRAAAGVCRGGTAPTAAAETLPAERPYRR